VKLRHLIPGNKLFMKLRHLIPACIFLMLCAFGAAEAMMFPAETIGIREGLPQSQPTCLAQDREGYIWVGTMGGLARYNGSRFVTYTKGYGLMNNRVRDLLVDRSGALWIATDGGTSLWRNHIMEVVLKGARCTAFAEDSRKNLWIATDRGLAVCPAGTYLPRYLGGPDQPLIFSVIRDGTGVIAASESALHRYEYGSTPTRLDSPPIPAAHIMCLGRGPEGLLVGTRSEGLWHRSARGWARTASALIPAKTINSITVQPSGALYVVTSDSGLFIRKPGVRAFEHWGMHNVLPTNSVNAAMEDREGNVWVAADICGLTRLGMSAMRNHGEKQGLPSSCVLGISGAANGTMWLGTSRGAVHYSVRPLPRVLEIVDKSDGLANEQVWQVLATSDGALWMLTDTALEYRPPGRRRVTMIRPDFRLPRTVSRIATDRAGRLWVCGKRSREKVAMRDEKGRWRTWDKTDDGDPIAPCTTLAARRKGGAWIAGQDRIYYCDGKSMQELKAAPPAENTYITALLEDCRGSLWVGTDTGLTILRNGTDPDKGGNTAESGMEKNLRWRIVEGASGEVINFIGEDENSGLWAGTNHGVLRIDRDGRIDVLTPDDGLASLETNEGAFCCDEERNVWIGTVSGLSQYDPGAVRRSTVPPSIVVESVEYGGRKVDFPSSLDLQWSERDLNFSLAVLSFRNRSRVAYRARLEGMESEWLPMRRLPELRYTNLPPGDLTLTAQAFNESGIRSALLTLPIRVRPPFWMTVPFKASAAAAFIALVFLLHRWRTRVLIRRKMAEAAREMLRKELKIAHDIQMSMLPRGLPVLGERPSFDIRASLRPAREIGGDFYDYFLLDEKRVMFVIADVVGKGIPAALLMMKAQTLVRSLAHEAPDPGEVLNLANREMALNNDSCSFITIFCGLLNIETGDLIYSSGGHDPPFLIKGSAELTLLDGAAGAAVGIDEDSTYEKEKVVLEPGDTICMYTDGITEAFNGEGKTFKRERLREVVEAHRNAPAGDLLEYILASVDSFTGREPQSDDITVQILRFRP
jgi:ligand-binding sensor domain-containing protein